MEWFADFARVTFGGIDKIFDVSSVFCEFSIGDKFFSIKWYGVIIAFGFTLAALFGGRIAYTWRINLSKMVDVLIYGTFGGIIGARAYYVIFQWDYYSQNPAEIFQIWNGGLAIYGGIICGCSAIVVVCLIKKINPFKATDMAAPGVMIGQLMGRWGNFFNAEAHGGVVSEGHPLYFIRMGLLPNEDSRYETYYYHPTFLYESLWNLIGFFIINAFYKKKKFNGQISCMYLAWYGFGRMFIEGLRTDSLYVGKIRISQLVGLLCFVIFGALLVWGLIYSKKFNEEDFEAKGFVKILVPSIVERSVTIEAEKAEMQAEKERMLEKKNKKKNEDYEDGDSD